MSRIPVWATRMKRMLLGHASAVTIATAMIITVVGLNSVVLAYGAQTVRERNQLTDHAQATLARLNEVAWILSDSAANAQNYIATNDQSSLLAYSGMHARFSKAISDLQALTADSPSSHRLLASFLPVMTSEMDDCQRAVALKQANEAGQAMQQITSAQYVRTVAAISTAMPQMVAVEEGLLTGGKASARAAEHMAFALMALATLANLALLIAAIVMLQKAMVLRQQTAVAQARAEARVQVLALEASNQRMSDFLAIASHELRTPLTSTKLGIDLAVRRLARFIAGESERVIYAGELEQFRNPFDTVAQQLARLERLVNNLFDLTRLRDGQLVRRSIGCDLVPIVRERVKEHSATHPDRSITLLVPLDAASLPILADPDLIGEVITNFVANALKYSAADRAVAVRVELCAQEARLSVTDEGPGLSQEAQEHVWERYYRAEHVEVRSGSEVGLGLGLYISRQIIEHHGGQVGVESELDRGSTFWFTLPVVPLPSSAANAPSLPSSAEAQPC